MSNVRQGKIDNNVSILNSGMSNSRALLVSPKTVESINTATIKAKEQPEVLYAEPPLVNRGPLNEFRPAQPEPIPYEQISPDTPLVAGQSSNPVNRFASRIVGFDVTGPTPVQPETVQPAMQPQPVISEVPDTPKIVPVSSNVPNVSLDPSQSYQTANIQETTVESQPQISPISNQPVVESSSLSSATSTNMGQVDQTAAAITTYLNTYQEPVRREVVEQQPLQTPQDFQPEEEAQDPYAAVDIKLEGMRAEINNDHNEFRQYFDMKFRSLVEEFNKKSEELNQRDNARIDEMSREIERARNSSKNNLRQIQSNQQEIINEYSGGIYNAR